MRDFKDKVAVITGGASGFGREFARLGATLGMKLHLPPWFEDRRQEIVATLEPIVAPPGSTTSN